MKWTIDSISGASTFFTLILTVFLLGVPAGKAAELPVFRVTEYDITPGQFNGKTYNLTLDQPLVSDHFILLRGASSGNKTRGVDDSYARVSELPPGISGQLSSSRSENTVVLERYRNTGDWEGVVKVVECLARCDSDGFRRRDVLSLQTAAAETSGQINSNAWLNEDQVVPFGGAFGGGSVVEYFKSGANNKYASGWLRLVPSGNNIIEWNRLDAGGVGLESAVHTIYVIEFGTRWQVQKILASGSSGGNGVDNQSEYDTYNINPVIRNNTWLWATGMSSEAGIGDGAEGVVVTLGNGIDKQSTESVVAVGSEYAKMRHFAVYTMSHPELATDYIFKPDGNKNDLEVDISTTTAGSSKMSWVSNTTNGTGSAFPRPIFASRYTASSTIRLAREYSGQNFAAWVQGVDFSGITYNTGMLGVDIIDQFGNSVSNALFALSSIPISLTSQTSTGSFGDNDHRIRITNTTSSPRWNLTLAPQGGSTAVWQGDAGNAYDYNDPTPSATDGVDLDDVGGQLTVDPVSMTIFPEFGCIPTGIMRGSQASFIEDAVNAVTLLTADDTAPTGCSWDILNIGLEQTIPAEQPVDSYSLDMVLTLTAY